MHIVSTPNAPEPAGHYSQATVHGGVIYVAGQVPKDPVSGEMKVATIEEQMDQVMKNIAAVLDAAGCSLNQVLKLTVYISDVAHWGAVNEVCKRHLGEHRPARAVIPVSRFNGFDIEADAIAAID